MVLYQVCSNQGLRVQHGLMPGAPGFETEKYIGNMKTNLLFQNHLAQMLEIRDSGLHSCALLSLLK